MIVKVTTRLGLNRIAITPVYGLIAFMVSGSQQGNRFYIGTIFDQSKHCYVIGVPFDEAIPGNIVLEWFQNR
jgi:hypothetical protein